MLFLCASSNTSLTSTDTQYAVCPHLCANSPLAIYIIMTFAITSAVFLLPVYLFILHLGFKQWRRQSFRMVTMSHFDLFTYHMICFELLGIISCCGLITDNHHLVAIGVFFVSTSQCGQLLLHILTCAERHLAVIHPITYRSLKGERWIGARNVAILLVWLFAILMPMNNLQHNSSNMYLIMFMLLAATLFFVLLFCVSVLRVLMHSGPGKGKGGKLHVDQSKLRAFYVIVGVLGVLVFRVSWNVLSGLLIPHISQAFSCGILAFTYWAGLPSSLLMPLMYLQRKKKLLCCK